MNHLSFSYSAAAVFFISSILTLAGCTEAGVDPDDHSEPIGVVISIDGTELLRQIGDSTVTLDTLRVGSITPHFEVRFLDEAGLTFEPHIEDGFTLSIQISDSSIVRLAEQVPPGDWTFRLAGTAPGRTSLRISLDHGGHSDFLSGILEIEVNE